MMQTESNSRREIDTDSTYLIRGTHDYVDGQITLKPATDLTVDEYAGILNYLHDDELSYLANWSCLVAIGRVTAQRFDNSGFGDLRPTPMYDGRWIAYEDGFWITYNGDPTYYDCHIPIAGTADDICAAIAAELSRQDGYDDQRA